MTTTIPSKETCFKCGEPASTGRDSKVTPALYMRLCQHCRRMELGCEAYASPVPDFPRGRELCGECEMAKYGRRCPYPRCDAEGADDRCACDLVAKKGCASCGSTDPEELVTHLDIGIWCDMMRKEEQARLEREATFTAPSCEVPTGLTLKDALVFSPFRDACTVVEAYVDSQGVVVAIREWYRVSDVEGSVESENGFNTAGDLPRGGGPAQRMRDYHAIPEETHLDEAYMRWVTHGELLHEEDVTYEEIVSHKPLQVRQAFGYDVD